jgi:hypothetical protein
MLLKLGQAGLAGFGAGYTITFAPQQEFKALTDLRFVINNQDRTLRHGPLS